MCKCSPCIRIVSLENNSIRVFSSRLVNPASVGVVRMYLTPKLVTVVKKGALEFV